MLLLDPTDTKDPTIATDATECTPNTSQLAVPSTIQNLGTSHEVARAAPGSELRWEHVMAPYYARGGPTKLG